MSKRTLISVAITMGLVGCTSVKVDRVDPSYAMTMVCIRENPKVQVDDFVPVIRDGFSRHSIDTKLYSGAMPDTCQYVLTYTALRSWDFTPYLSHAELRIEKDGKQIAYAEYHLKGKGGFSLTKWAGTKDKMDPVIDELLRK